MAGTIVVGTIVDRARLTLLETSVSDVRWARTTELLPHANAAFREIAASKPDAYVKNQSFALAAGAKQTVPADFTQFFNAEHNLGVDGLTPGVAIVPADRMQVSRANRNWMTATGAAVEQVIYDQRDPKTFYVYPRPSGTWYINLVGSAVPPSISAANIDSATLGLIPVDDIYDSFIHDYICGYALLKTFKAGDATRASYFLTKAYAFIGKRFDAMMNYAPLDADAAEKTDNALGKA